MSCLLLVYPRARSSIWVRPIHRVAIGIVGRVVAISIIIIMSKIIMTSICLMTGLRYFVNYRIVAKLCLILLFMVVITMMPILTKAKEMAVAATADNAKAGKTDSDPEAAHCPAVFTVLG